MYEILFHNEFKKDIKKFSKKIKVKIEEMVEKTIEPDFVHEQLKGDLKNIYKLKFKIDKTEYRIAYCIEKAKIIFLMVKNRENFYEYLKRRILL